MPEPIELDREVLKLHKLRKIFSKAWLPMGISADEGCDILQWAVADEPYKIHISKWPELIMQRTGVMFDPKHHTMVSILREVALAWRKRKKIIFYPTSKN